jgi:high affinity cGMP-specific 3',5'-cyclic phosphodiesterase 9
MNAVTELAICYNDSSPLENHHCGKWSINSAMLFSILSHDFLDFLAPLSPADYKELRKTVIGCILATDMGKHADLVGKTRELDGKFSIDDPAHKTLVN